uniref:Uncharacterized protein n=1 Tax=Romanomermis culicivorax TaxID=13658 RepID=A0A915HEX8_ROMCU
MQINNGRPVAQTNLPVNGASRRVKSEKGKGVRSSLSFKLMTTPRPIKASVNLTLSSRAAMCNGV